MKRLQRSSLRVRLLVICLLVLVPAFGAMSYALHQQRQHELREVKEQATLFAGLVAVEETRRIEDTRNLLISASRAPAVRVPESKSCAEYLKDLLERYPRYRNFGVASPSGTVVCSALPFSGRVDISDRDYFRAVLRTGDFSAGAYQIGRITRRPGINFGYPILGEDGRLKAVIYAAMDVAAFGRLGREVARRLHEGTTLTKIDASGVVLGRHPVEERLGGKPFPDWRAVEALLPQGEGLTVAETGTGERSVFAVARVPEVFAGSHAYVVAAIPERTAFAEIHDFYVRSVTVLGIGFAVALGMVWLGSGYFIRRPVQVLLEATNRVAEGDASVRMGPPYEKGELGDLARDFDRMTAAIEARHAESEHAQEALLRSEENYRSIVRNAPLGIYRSTPDGRLLMVNPSLVTMLGYGSEDELMGVKLDADVYVDPEERWRILHGFAGRSHGSVLVAEVDWKRKDGGILKVRASGIAVRNPDGSTAYYEVFVEDETARHTLETQFLHAQRLEAVGRLAGGVAHDFNNLLSVILGYSEMILGPLGADSPLRPKVEEVRKAAERAAKLTGQLLAFSRKQVLEPKVLNLNDVIFGASRMFRRLMGEDVELLLNLSTDIGRVRIDPAQLEQVIMNLVVNARDAMPQGGKLIMETQKIQLREPDVRVHGDVTMPAGSYDLLAVSDTGCGMEPATLRKIFEPFFTTKEAGKGTGLGLSTVYGIVKQSGGFIWAYSEPGKGSTFKIYLPMVAEEGDAVAADDAPPDLPPGGVETVLVVEDDPSIRDLIREFLSSFGYSVLLACDAVEALQLCRTHDGPIDLLLTDVVMPGESGPALAERVTQVLGGTPVLYMSGYSYDAVSEHGVLKEGTFFLAKPFTRDMLAKKVRQVLDSRAA